MQNWIAGGVSDEAGPSAMGGAIDGMLADTVVLSEDGVVALPPHLSFEEGATLPCAAVTAWAALVTHGALKAGETVLVQGTGGVSIFALQFAKMMGARVIATSSSDAKIARLKEMGADATVNYKSHPDWEREVRALTDRRGVDHVVEVGGAGTLAKSLQAVRTGGRISLIGVLTGPAEINPTPIMQRYVTLQGLYVGSRESFEAMNRAIEANGMRPVIDRVFPFADAPAAFRYFETQQHFGKVVIKHD
jgi:NADPH:quinone reductase-like Zn-dependent oxidoreductase